MFLAFFLVKIQLFSGRKQTYFRCRILSGFKDGRQVIVPVPLEFTGGAMIINLHLNRLKTIHF